MAVAVGSEPHSDRHQWHCLSCLTLEVRKKKEERQRRTKKTLKREWRGKGWMLCIGAREKNKIKLLWPCFSPAREKENCGRGDWGGDWRYDVKMPNGENYVWVRKQKKAQRFFFGVTGLPLWWWSQRAPYGPIIIWTLGAGVSECEREESCVCAQRSAWTCWS